MTVIVALAAYVLAGLLTVRPVAGHFAYKFSQAWAATRDRPDGEQWYRATILALLVATIWPVLLVWTLSGRYGPTLGEEGQAVIRAQEKRIQELEKLLKD